MSQIMHLQNFVDLHKYCQLNSTDDRCQFITLSIYLCVQHDGHDATRFADSSMVEGFFVFIYEMLI